MRTPTRKHRDPQLAGEIAGLETLDANEATRLQEDYELPVVAIVGRPNVGKSTLFNRLIGRRKAIVHDRPGVTRDRNIERAEIDGVPFLCIDTGGFDTVVDDPLIQSVVEQVRLAIQQADVIVFLAAVHEPAHPADHEIVRLLRATDKPVVAAINKCDSPAIEHEAADFYRFGFEKIYPITALHGVGTGDLMDAVLAALRTLAPRDSRERTVHGGVRLAVIGRQNVGKSTLINQLAGEQRMIVADHPGTTRDAIDTEVRAPDGRVITLIDTAGIRRRGRVERGVEQLSVLASMLSLRRANVAALVIDAEQGPTEQDAHVAGYCVEAGLPTMILVNKWDIVAKDHRTADQFTHHLEQHWGFMRHAPVLYVSALTGQRTPRIFDVAERILANALRRIGTHELNERLAEWIGQQPPPMRKNRRPKIRFITQTGTLPPRFVLMVNDPELIHFSYQRHLINRLRDTYDFEGSPIRLLLRVNRKHRPGDPQLDQD